MKPYVAPKEVRDKCARWMLSNRFRQSMVESKAIELGVPIRSARNFAFMIIRKLSDSGKIIKDGGPFWIPVK